MTGPGWMLTGGIGHIVIGQIGRISMKVLHTGT